MGDSHCHLAASCTVDDAAAIVAAIGGDSRVDGPNFFSLMSTNHIDIDVIEKIKAMGAPAVFPYFGVHPWFSHLFSDGPVDKRAHYQGILAPEPGPGLLEVLPQPIDINGHLDRMRRLLARHGGGVGEVGLDKAFRVPTSGFYGASDAAAPGDEKLSPCRVSMAHQQMILSKQLLLADELRVPVSLHCVRAHGVFYDTVRVHQHIPSVVLHSFSGSADQAKMWVRAYARSAQHLYFSFSNYINGADGKDDALARLVAVLDPAQVLVETDYPIDLFLDRWDEYVAQLDSILAKIGAQGLAVAANQQRVCEPAPAEAARSTKTGEPPLDP